jgi:hypothetical protein
MCSRVAALTPVAPRIAMETSAVDTPARAATSVRVGRFPPGSGGIDGLPFRLCPGPVQAGRGPVRSARGRIKPDPQARFTPGVAVAGHTRSAAQSKTF